MREVSLRSGRIPLVVALTAVWLGLGLGCSLIVNTDGLYGGTGGASVLVDAASDADSSSGADAAGGASFCASANPVHQFCEDFDEGSLSEGWTSVDNGSTTAIELDTTAKSTPRSARCRLVAGKSCGNAELRKSFPTVYAEARVAFDVRLGAKDAPVYPGDYIASVEVGKCNHLVQVFPTATAVYTQIDFPAGEDRRTTNVTLSPGVWARVELDVDRNDGSVQLSIDGVVVIAKSVVDTRCVGAATFKLALGPYCENEAVELRLDNITFDGK